MSFPSHFLLPFTIFLLLFHQNFSFPSKQTLLLPLRKSLRASAVAVSANAATDKLAFHHNVTLTVSLSVGSPPQPVTMVLDTGSELSWLHCKKTPNLNSVFALNFPNLTNPSLAFRRFVEPAPGTYPYPLPATRIIRCATWLSPTLTLPQ
ncbi:hypothetical protein GQ457_12G032050 [Hibiscus cannabinus]